MEDWFRICSVSQYIAGLSLAMARPLGPKNVRAPAPVSHNSDY